MTAELWEELIIYLDLAMAFRNRRMLTESDRALLMAGCCASLAGINEVASYCREQVLQRNPAHLVRRWPDFTTALEAEDFQVFIKQVSAKTPIEQYSKKLKELGYSRNFSRQDFDAELDFIAEILRIDAEYLSEL
ncbi:MAG: hypothetical protein KF851_18040 [Pirellulaceae bacterium]|nr:hypothetical protein [Pirellulaceae bacterium]